MNSVATLVDHSSSRFPFDARGHQVSEADAQDAFRKILHWIGEDPDRDGLRETPARLARAFREYFAGYGQDPGLILQKTFEETDGYDEMIVLRGIPFESHCEHHVAPIIGRAWVGYVPDRRVVGISKLARVRGGVRPAAANSGTADVTGRQYHRSGSQAAGRCGRDQGETSLREEPRRSKARNDLVTSRMPGRFREDALMRAGPCPWSFDHRGSGKRPLTTSWMQV